jgi:hypothetical protein
MVYPFQVMMLENEGVSDILRASQSLRTDVGRLQIMCQGHGGAPIDRTTVLERRVKD